MLLATPGPAMLHVRADPALIREEPRSTRRRDHRPWAPGPGGGTVIDVSDDVLDRLRAGDEDAYREIVGAWSARMRTLARAHVHSDATAEEVVQEAWVAVVRGLWAFEGRAALRTWVYRIVVNIARRRGAAERRAHAELTDRPPDVRDRRPGPEDEVIGRETRRRLVGTLAVLPPRQRAVLALRDLEGLDRQTVHTLLGLSDVAQRAHLSRGRARLRELAAVAGS